MSTPKKTDTKLRSKINSIISVSQDYGITSIEQLRVFVMHAVDKPMTCTEASGVDAYDPDYKRHYSIVKKLSNKGYRGYDGLDLLKLGEHTGNGKERVVITTRRGTDLAKKLGLLK